ncbi:MAG: ATP-binding protein [Anaerolineaceae bacterium]|nr:ATP-binding protein [Anaerolineaceae bacterium]
MDPIKSIMERIARDFIPPEHPAASFPSPENRFGLGDPDCPVCHGTGFVIRGGDEADPTSGVMTACSCRVKKFEGAGQKAKALNANLSGYENMRFDNFNVEGRGQLRDEQKANLAYARDCALKFADSPVDWLLFTGRYGTGKTHLAAAIANSALEKGIDLIFQPVPDLLDQLRMSYGGAAESFEERFDRIRSIPLLILDDLGAQSPTAWAEEKLYQIINYRYVNRLPTVVTSNVSMREMDGRIASRLRDGMVTHITMQVPDYRDPLSGAAAEDDISILHLLYNRTFDNFDSRRSEHLSDRAVAELARAYSESLAFAQDPSGWLVLTGPSGIGKTHLAAAIGNYRKDRMESPIFVTASDLLDHLRATFSPSSTATYDSVFDHVRGASLLIINYLDTMNATPWAREKMYQILNYRYQAQLPTVITLLKTVQEVDPNIRSRLVDANFCTVVQMFDVPMYNTNPDIDLAGMLDGRRKKKI